METFWKIGKENELTTQEDHHLKGWIAQMEEHWYGNPEVSGSSPGSVKFYLPIFQIFLSRPT